MIAAEYCLAFLSWIASKCTNQWKLVLVVASFSAIVAGAILGGIKGGTASLPWPATLLLIAAVALSGVLWGSSSAVNEASKRTFRLQRLIYRYFRSGMPLGGATSVSVRAKLVISQHFTSIRFRRNDQHRIADKIVAGIRNRSKLFAIEGPSGVGKTSAAIVVLDRIITDTEVSEHAMRILYCDLAASPDGMRDLLGYGNAGLLESTFLILDNFHRIAPERLRDFSEFLRNGDPPCRALLLLTQPQEFMAFCPPKNIDALRRAEDRGTLYRMPAPQPLEIQQTFSASKNHDQMARALDKLGVAYEAPTRWVAHVSMERAYQMALDDGSQIVQDLLLAPVNDGDISNLPGSLLRVIAAISALALHRGVFTQKELDACFRRLAPNGYFLNSSLRHLRSDFKRLKRAGFVLEAIGRRRVYVFHQTLAEHFRDRFRNSKEFSDAFGLAGAEIRTMAWVTNDPLMRWLFAVELSDTGSIRAGFPAAMMSGAFGQMRRTFDRNAPSDMDFSMNYVRGILAEKVGAWTEARYWLRIAASQPNGADANDLAKARLAEIEAAHGNDVRHELEAICQDSRVGALSRLSARYWLLHMDAHHGRFDIDNMRTVVHEIEDGLLAFEAEDPYQLLHLARRAYFDLVRFHYLAGTTDDDFLVRHSSRGIARYLSRNLVTFEAYCEKFLFGHRIHYDHVFQLRVLKQRPVLTGVSDSLPAEADNDLPALVSAAIEHYKLSAKMFSVFGDKTAEYIAPRIYELDLMRDDADLDKLLPQLNDYKKFIDGSGLAELQPYPDVYYFKFHLKRAQQLLLRIRTFDDGSLASAEHDVEMRRACDALERARLGFESAGNQYGSCMCRLYGGTLARLRPDAEGAARGEIGSVRATAEQFGYQRILSVLKRLDDRPLTPGDVYDAILYFPFVHQ